MVVFKKDRMNARNDTDCVTGYKKPNESMVPPCEST
jgi:hypothetical protein